MKNKNKLIKGAFALNGFLFLLGGITLIDDQKLVFAIFQLLAAVLNLTMLLKIRGKKILQNLNYLILTMNVIVCISIAVDYILSHKSYIQFVWIIAAFFSFVALLIQIKKRKILRNK